MTVPTPSRRIDHQPDAVPLVADPLAEALHLLRMDGTFYCLSILTGPWGITLPTMADCLWFHVITEGSCSMVDAAGQTHDLEAGDVVVLPRGGGHRAFDRPSANQPVVFDLPHDYLSRQYAILEHGGGGTRTSLICGLAQFGHPSSQFLIDLLPDVIHVGGDVAATWDWFAPLMALMADETRQAQPGGEAVVTRLSDILVIQAVRAWIDQQGASASGWIGALRDPAVGQAIGLIHRDPAHPWSVAELADAVAMSRSAFAARFTQLAGEPVMQYVTRWRIHLATDVLRSEDASVLEVALRHGYGSEAAFSRACKRVTGQSPSALRAAPSPQPIPG